MTDNTIETAIFANGCFWCTEAIFQKINGVIDVLPGYIGGDVINPTYEQVCTGTTNHAEALKISFDKNVVSYDLLLEVFFATHDPTSLNRQGEDIGTQYRSEIFYTNNHQENLANKYILQLNEQEIFDKPIVTKVTQATEFYIAEDYHKNYFNSHPERNYCAFVIAPKVQKFKQYYKDYLK